MGKNKVERSFGGVLVTSSNYKEMPPEQRKLEKKHLRAYLRGDKHYTHGFIETPNDFGLIERRPAIYVTKETIKNLN